MNVQTADLIRRPLDWAMGVALGQHPDGAIKPYTTDWALLGPLLQPHGVEVYLSPGGEPAASIKFKTQVLVPAGFRVQTRTFRSYPAISYEVAACRCIVASVLGDSVDVPDQLLS